MTGLAHWRDAHTAAEQLTGGDRRLLLLLARLPLIWEGAVERLHGLRGGASVYRRLSTPGGARGRWSRAGRSAGLGAAVSATSPPPDPQGADYGCTARLCRPVVGCSGR